MPSEAQNRFSMNPANIDIPRSLFDRSCNRYQTVRAAEIVPFYLDEYLPGDSCSIKTKAFIRMSKPILPTMQPLYCDIFYFAVPMRLIFNNYKQFFGENDQTAWTRPFALGLPKLDDTSIGAMLSQGNYVSGCLLDYLGVHLGVDDDATNVVPTGGTKAHLYGLKGINTLPIRAYYSVVQNWFRDESYDAPLAFSKGDTGTNDYMISDNGYTHYVHRSGLILAHSLFDYFTSVLPAPQKHGDIIPVGSAWSTGVAKIPVAAGDEHIGSGDSAKTILFREVYSGLANVKPTDGTVAGFGGSGQFGPTSVSGSASAFVTPTNLWANIPEAVFASVNQIRYAFALQRFFEKDARGGTRYNEKVKAHFGVTGSDTSYQIPEYLGGERFMLNMDTIVTTADTSDGTTGEIAGYSKTFKEVNGFSKSFSEHGYIIGVMVIRPKPTYFQGVPKLFKRSGELDFYWPSFANISEQPVDKSELFACSPDEPGAGGVFGYQEAYAEYRYKPDEICGDMRSTAHSPLLGYTYARKFGSALTATAANARVGSPADVSQNLAVPAGVQFCSMIHVDGKWRRPMPVYSIPGLVDHH